MFLSELSDGLLSQVIGGSASQAVAMGALFLITILVVVLLIARIDLGAALIIVSPAIIVGSFVGWLPPLAFGVSVLLIAFFFTGVILSFAR